MKRIIVLALIAASVFPLSINADLARYVTIQVKGHVTNEVAIAAHETAELVSYVPLNSAVSDLVVVRSGVVHEVRISEWNRPSKPFVVTGPAILRHVGIGSLLPSFCTFKITPSGYEPEKTVVMPGDGVKAAVTLEVSGNLATWMPATNGVYSGSASPRFFRIKLETLRASD